MPGSSAFPAALDTFPAIGPNTREDDPAARHDVVHENVHAAIAATQARVGIDGSEDPDSLAYRLATTEALVAALIANRFPAVVDVSGTAYELTPADIGRWLRFTAATEVEVTIGAGPWPTSVAIEMQQAGAGPVTVVVDASNLELAESLQPTSAEAGAVFGLKRTSPIKWALFGMLAPA